MFKGLRTNLQEADDRRNRTYTYHPAADSRTAPQAVDRTYSYDRQPRCCRDPYRILEVQHLNNRDG
jgi:hypothetical protein